MNKILEEFSQNSVKYFDYIIKNISFFVIFISVLGCTIQFINLLPLSPYFITFYSTKQGIIDGLLFIIFCIGCFVTYGFFFYIYLIKIFANWGKSALYTYFATLILFFVIGYIYVIEKKMEFVGLILAIPILIIIILIQSVISPEPHSEIEFIEDEEKLKEIDRRSDKFLKRLLLLFVFIFYGIFISANQHYRKFQNKNNYNFELLIEKINNKHMKKFKILYANSDYIFLEEISSNKILIVNMEAVTKEFVYE